MGILITVKYLITLLRLKKTLIVILFPIIGSIATFTSKIDIYYALLCGILYALYWGASFAINDFYDIKIDKINSPDRILTSEKIPKSYALIWALVLYSSINAITILFLNHLSIILVVVITILGVLYSQKLKIMGVAGDFAIFIISFLGVIFGDLAINNTMHIDTFCYAVCIAMLMYVLQIMYAIRDIKGDKINGSKSMAVILGPLMSNNIITIIFIFDILIIICINHFHIIQFNRIFIILGFILFLLGLVLMGKNIIDEKIEFISQYHILPELGILFILFSFLIPYL